MLFYIYCVIEETGDWVISEGKTEEPLKNENVCIRKLKERK
jgi:hypothetical protein